MSFLLALAFLLPGRPTLTQRCVIANQDCFVLRPGYRNHTPRERMDRLNERLADILPNAKPTSLHAIACWGGYAIYADHTLLVTVTPADAQANGLAPEVLTRLWLHNLRSALAQERP